MTDCKTCTERQGYYLDAETIANQQEHIAELKCVNSEYMDINHEQGMQLIEHGKRIKQLEAQIAELTAKVDEQSELIAARGKTIETLEHMLAEKKAKYREVREKMLDYQRKLKAERDEYRELYEAAMSTDYAQAARERDAMSEQIDQIRSIIDEAPYDRLTHE